MDIWYQCIYGIVCPLSLQNIFCIWRPGDSISDGGDRISAALDMHKILHRNVQNAWHLSRKRYHNVVNTVKIEISTTYRGYPAKRALPAMRMADRALLAGYPQYPRVQWVNLKSIIKTEWYIITKKSRFMCPITGLRIATKLQGKKYFFLLQIFKTVSFGSSQMVMTRWWHQCTHLQVIYKTASSKKEAMHTQVAL